jgi:hypothetical protein
VDDLCWLRSRGYAETASLVLVGNHYQLTVRQRQASCRCSVSDAAAAARAAAEVPLAALAGQPLVVDGFNVLVTVESALAGGVLLRGRDHCLRDMASVHGSYRRVAETEPALIAIGETLTAAGAADTHFLLDRPVSNSGRLKTRMLALAAERGWPWSVDLVMNPDRELAATTQAIATADAWALDQGGPWVNLAAAVVAAHVSDAWVITL